MVNNDDLRKLLLQDLDAAAAENLPFLLPRTLFWPDDLAVWARAIGNKKANLPSRFASIALYSFGRGRFEALECDAEKCV